MQGKYVLLGLVLLVGGYDLFNNVATQASSQVPDEPAAANTHGDLEPWSAAHRGVKIEGAFMQVRELIHTQFPGTEVLGTGYPVPVYKELLCKLVFLAQLAVSAVALAGDAIFRALNMPPPAIYLEYREKKMGVLVGVWILGNMVQNALTQTGAFEVYSAGELIFSKLEAGRMPRLDELMSGLQRTLIGQ